MKIRKIETISFPKNKRGVSIMVGYVLLITFAVIMGSVIYTWMKSYVPTEPTVCPDGVSVYITEIGCSPGHMGFYLKNNGRFSVDGYFIRVSTDADQEVATTSIFSKISESTGRGQQGYVRFWDEIGKTYDTLNPGERIPQSYNGLTNDIYLVELVPVRFQTENNLKKLVTCSDAKIRERIICDV